MHLDPLVLSRLQFAWVIGFHILLPAFTIGLASYVALIEMLYFFTTRDLYLSISTWWTKILAISFGMGVVSGIVMPFQFGTNWSRYAAATANVLSPLFAYEGLTAFFLEATFLGILLFGRKLIPRWVHLMSAIIVALGTLMSAFWILAANSWMHTPAGFKLMDNKFFPVSWIHIIFNPSFPYRFLHNVNGFYITTGFVVIAAGAYLIRKTSFVEEGKNMLSMTFWLLTFLVPLQFILGDLHGLNTLKYQPTKLAAIEANWEPARRVPLILFAIPDIEHETNHAVLEVPILGSLILTHNRNGLVPGLKEWPKDERPPVSIPFFAFRLMFGLGMFMLTIVMISLWLRWRGRLFTTGWFLRLCQLTAPIGFLAVIAGWLTTEVGRQPWTVYGLLRTGHSLTPSLTSTDVLFSLAGYLLVYLIIFPVGIIFMSRIIRKGPMTYTSEPVEGGQPRAPVITQPEYTNDH